MSLHIACWGRNAEQCAWTFALFVLVVSAAYGVDRAESFEKRVRPLLVEHCYACHSGSKTSGGLSLEFRSGWETGGDSGPAIVPGNPAESLVIQAVRDVGGVSRMPPEGTAERLTEQQIAVLEEWIQKGAADPREAIQKIGGMSLDEARNWWAFQPLHTNSVTIEPPPNSDSPLPHHTIDAFINAGLRSAGIAAAPPTDRAALIRRMSFDLTGLPPTPSDVSDFLNDASPQAIDKLIERLLASPAYGERWARHWLDVVRYTDYFLNPKDYSAAFSYEVVEAFRYRDWVTSALNRDLPFDQFVKMQIAGDLIPNADGTLPNLEGMAAVGLLSLGSVDHGDADKDKIVSDIVDDQIDVVGKAFLGLTLSCARCHDHKFDPITTADYYALAGIFYSSHSLADIGAKGAATSIQRLPFVTSEERQNRTTKQDELKGVLAKLEERDSKRADEFLEGGVTFMPVRFSSTSGAIGTVAEDGSITTSGANVKDVYTVEVEAKEAMLVKAVRLEPMADTALPVGGPGRAGDGNFVLTQFAATITKPSLELAAKPIQWSQVTAGFEQAGFPASGLLQGQTAGGWAISPQRGKNHAAIFELTEALSLQPGDRVTFTMSHQYADTYSLGKFRISALSEQPKVLSAPDPERDQWKLQRDGLQAALAVPEPLAVVVGEGGTKGSLFPGIQDVPIHVRGSYAKLGPVVQRRMPDFLAGDTQPAIEGSGRLALANWIARKENPLTARVIVNRVWQHHFGKGLVGTPSNVGKLGEPPSHPDLLEWLSSQFIRDGLSLKQLHRHILRSATYQRSSQIPENQRSLDPANRWLGRMPVRRLEAEAFRDAMLSVSGELDLRFGGPALADVMIPRRSLYVATTRYDRENYSTLFDAANPEQSTEQRSQSIVAPQALFLMNHPFAIARAKALAATAELAAPDLSQRIDWLHQRLFSRTSTDKERDLGLQFVHEVGWVDYAHALLCSNEFLFID